MCVLEEHFQTKLGPMLPASKAGRSAAGEREEKQVRDVLEKDGRVRAGHVEGHASTFNRDPDYRGGPQPQLLH